jgi:diguanylate cyclase (GGDEF)-like protein
LTFEDVLGHVKAILESSIKNIQLYDELTTKARYDALTQLYNRSAFGEFLEKEIKRVERYKHKFCLAMIDLDDLKKINDLNGHLYGDMVLKSFAEMLKAGFRQTDIVGRYGGDEFIILFVETDLQGATIAIERLYQLLNAKNFPSSCSIGLTEFKKGDTAEELIKRADTALYNAKQSGKKHLEVI